MSASILVIEDNPPNLELMRFLLTAFGHRVTTATTGEEGLELAQTVALDMILCDVQLPMMDGFEVLHALKRSPLTREKPVVAVTAFAMVGDRDKIISAGFHGYIAKPISPETFVTMVEAFLPTAQRSTNVPTTTTTETEMPALPRLSHATILVVDDNPANLHLTRSILEPFGYQVAVANSVFEALEMARKSPPDLILCDFHMPVQSGADLLHLFRADEQLKNIPVAIFSSTAYAFKDEIDRLGLAPDHFISRPINPQELLAKLENLLQTKPE